MKQTVHNVTEIKALVKEAYMKATELDLHKAKWFSHDGKFLATSHIRDTEFELVVEDVNSLDGYRSVIVEVI